MNDAILAKKHSLTLIWWFSCWEDFGFLSTEKTASTEELGAPCLITVRTNMKDCQVTWSPGSQSRKKTGPCERYSGSIQEYKQMSSPC